MTEEMLQLEITITVQNRQILTRVRKIETTGTQPD